MSSPADSSQSTAASAKRALINIAVAAVVLGGTYFAYARYVQGSKQVKELSKKSFDLIQKDNLKDYRDAAGMLDEALAIRGKDPFALSARAEVASLLWLEHGQADSADTAKSLSQKAAGAEMNLAERFSAEGMALIADGKAQDAASQLETLAKNGAATAKVVAALGLAHERLGQLDVAKSDFKQAADRDWRNPRFAGLYADSFFDGGDFINAQNTYQKALELNAGHVRSLVGKARSDIARNERIDEAQKSLDEVLQLPADQLSPVMKARALAGKAEAALATGDLAAAEKSAQDAIALGTKIDPAFGYAQFDLGLALAKQKKDGALDAFKAAIAQYPAIARFYFQGANALAVQGKAADGETLFAEYLKTQKENDAFHIAKGDFLLATGSTEGALKEYDAAIEASGMNAESYYKKGFALQQQASQPKADRKKLFDGAREAYEKAVSIRERYPEVYRQMGLIYLDLKPTSAEALENFGKALGFYKEQKAPKATIEEFIAEVEQRYLKANLKANAAAWRKEATQATK